MIRQAIILCGGGFGTRLGPLTARTPKSLLPIDQAPFLDVLLFELGRHGLRRILLLAGFAADQLVEYARTTALRARFGLNIEVLIEPQPAGTGGALWQARDRLDRSFLLLNGDSWFDINLLEFGCRIPGNGSVEGVIALRPLADAARFGIVDLSDEHIVGFTERPAQTGPGLVSGGVYAFRHALLDYLGPQCSLERDVFPRLAEAGRLLGAEYPGYFIDIGVPDDLSRARREIPDQRIRPAVFLDRNGVVNHDGGKVGSSAPSRLIEGTKATIKGLNDAGLFVFVVGDQPDDRFGLYSEAEFHAVNAELTADLATAGAHVDEFRYCPFRPQPADPADKLIELLSDWPVDRVRSFFVGEQESVLAAAAAGIAGHPFTGGNLAVFIAELVAIHTR
jgi:D-glycero-D-manno-heptose 1,7-bisphosphate phosphatase